jgi:hypothetical protein
MRVLSDAERQPVEANLTAKWLPALLIFHSMVRRAALCRPPELKVLRFWKSWKDKKSMFM